MSLDEPCCHKCENIRNVDARSSNLSNINGCQYNSDSPIIVNNITHNHIAIVSFSSKSEGATVMILICFFLETRFLASDAQTHPAD